MKRAIAGLLCMALVSPSVLADATGAGDAAILSELTAQTTKLAEQLKTMREALDINKRMQEMEEMRAVHVVVREGMEMKNILDNVSDMENEINTMTNSPGGLDQTQSDIERFQRNLDHASEEEGLSQAKSYAYLMADLKRLKFLGTANRETMKKMGQGTNETDDTKAIATNTMIMSDVIVEKEKRETRRRGNEVNALQELMGGVKYSSMQQGRD